MVACDGSENKDRVVAKIILGIAVIPHHAPRTPFDVVIQHQFIASRRLAAFQMSGALDNVGGKSAN